MNTDTRYKWHVDVILKGSGVIKRCIYEGPEDNTQDVFIKLFRSVGTAVDMRGEDEKCRVFIATSEIASVEIYPKGRTTQ